ncbi:MAG: winged helix-turn-helix domain-containing protein [Candidatus Binatia bacterium]
MKRALVLDVANGQVWRDKQRLELPPKAVAVLRYLIEHADRVVSKEELFTAVWPDVVVSEWALTTCLRRLRRVLGERAQTPHYIETVARRGYRWIGEVQSPKPVLSPSATLRIDSAEGSKVQSLQSAIRIPQSWANAGAALAPPPPVCADVVSTTALALESCGP